MSALRPSFHFAPKAGWINDPNGLVRVDGVYHMFYQANPHGLVHGPMHWGHASSTDLAIWTEHAIALYPEPSGQCFSGSAVAAREGNVAPELRAGDGILMFYTAHRDGGDGVPYVEDQAVAIADRGMTRFEKFAGNPVLQTPGPLDFRDPKVIWHAATARWIMVVTHGQSVGFYSSPDALRWQFESEFGAEEGRHGPGPWECPDLIRMHAGESGAEVWVLVVGLGRGHVSGGSGTQYFVGDFDGHRFRNFHSPETELVVDWGRDFYAAQSFSGLGDEAPLVLAWMTNWQYANQMPHEGYRGSMSLPRRLDLVETGGGLRLSQAVDPLVAARFDLVAPAADDKPFEPGSPVYRIRQRLPDTTSTLAVSLFGEAEPVVTLDRADNGVTVTVFRQPHPTLEAERDFATRFSFFAEADGEIDLDIFVDHGHVEIGCCGGRHWSSMLYFPVAPDGAVRIMAR